MPIRQQVLGVMLAVLIGGTGGAWAQGRAHRMGATSERGLQSDALQAMEPQMQQLGGLMHQIAERIKAGPLTPDQTLHLSGIMEQMATIMTKMAAGIPGVDTAAQLGRMQEQLTAMQPQATLKVAPSSTPEPAPPLQQP